MNISVLYTKMVLLEQGDNTQEMIAQCVAQEYCGMPSAPALQYKYYTDEHNMQGYDF